MNLKDWVDLFTGGGAAISAIAAGVAAWASRTSAGAAKESSASTRAAISSNERIADNDRRIRLMEERMRVWRAFDNLFNEYLHRGVATPEMLFEASREFQLAPFLFPNEIDAYLHKINKRMFCQMFNEAGAGRRRAEMEFPQQIRDQRKELNLRTWLGNQQREGKKKFQKYMSIAD